MTHHPKSGQPILRVDGLTMRFGGFTANRRVVGIRGGLEFGDFFSGTRSELNLNLNIRPRRGVRVQLEGEWNDVELLEGSFQTRVYRLISDTQFSPSKSF